MYRSFLGIRGVLDFLCVCVCVCVCVCLQGHFIDFLIYRGILVVFK